MASQTLLFAVSIPLAVLLFIVLVALVLFIIFSRSSERVLLSKHDEEVNKLQNQLQVTPQSLIYGTSTPTNRGLSYHDIKPAFDDLGSSINKLLSAVKNSETPPKPEEWINGILFNDEEPVGNGDFASIFPNPHQYTATEICAYLSHHLRKYILRHVILSMVLPAVMLNLNASPANSLLPFRPQDLESLSVLMRLIRGEKLSDKVLLYLSNFALYGALGRTAHGAKSRLGFPWGQFNRELYIDKIQSLISPYLVEEETRGVIPPSESLLREQIHEMLDKAILFGMRAMGYSMGGEVAISWGPRVEGVVVAKPALWELVFAPDKSIVWRDPQKLLQQSSEWSKAEDTSPTGDVDTATVQAWMTMMGIDVSAQEAED